MLSRCGGTRGGGAALGGGLQGCGGCEPKNPDEKLTKEAKARAPRSKQVKFVDVKSNGARRKNYSGRQRKSFSGMEVGPTTFRRF